MALAAQDVLETTLYANGLRLAQDVLLAYTVNTLTSENQQVKEGKVQLFPTATLQILPLSAWKVNALQVPVVAPAGSGFRALSSVFTADGPEAGSQMISILEGGS